MNGELEILQCPKCGQKFSTTATISAKCRWCGKSFTIHRPMITQPNRAPPTTVFIPASELPRGNFEKGKLTE